MFLTETFSVQTSYLPTIELKKKNTQYHIIYYIIEVGF